MAEERCLADQILVGLRDGCFCLSLTVDQFLGFISSSLNHLKSFQASSNGDQVLEIITVFESFITFSVLKRRQFYCRRLLDFLLILVNFKQAILIAITRVLQVSQDAHIIRQCHRTLTHIICVLPCKMSRREEDFDSLCDEICQPVIKKHMNAKFDLHEFGIHLVHGTLTLNETDKHFANCQTSKITVTGDGLVHLRSTKHEILNDLRKTWRSGWISQALLPKIHDQCTSEGTLKILDLWHNLVDVRNASITFAQSREFTNATKLVVDMIPVELDQVVKLKVFAILNQVLCYGSTLGIQSEIPIEPSELAQKILQKALRSVVGPQPEDHNHFNAFHVPESHSGLAGNSNRLADEQALLPSVQIIKSIVLIYVKSVAVVVKESQAVSSSSDDNSDCSLSSRGSSSLAEEEQEINLIAGNVLEILRHLTTWSNRVLNRHHSSNLTSTVIELFGDQDDALIEALLCILDININCYNQTNYFNQYHSQMSESAMVPNMTATTAIVDMLDPIQGFEGLAASVSNDHSVLLDFLVSNETCFLLYFLRFLKFLCKRTPPSTRQALMSQNTSQVLSKIKTSIQKLTDKSLFPYDIAPVLKLLEKVA